MRQYESWGKFPRTQQSAQMVPVPFHGLTLSRTKTYLPFGNGRSYGDVCLNSHGELLDTSQLNHLLEFDISQGVLHCESGVTLDDILRVYVPKGWFLPVTPGTKFITVGGAVANDVHGKNHHRDGSFGRYVTGLTLWRSDQGFVRCSEHENPDLFHATIGGMGLTGLILSVQFKLRRIDSAMMRCETTRFSNLDEFSNLLEVVDSQAAYYVAWVDCMAQGADMGRGLLMSGEHCGSDLAELSPHGSPVGSVPFEFPNGALNPWTIRWFNSLYYARQKEKRRSFFQHYDPFFYPLDRILNWNRIYGRRGFLQYQCVVPTLNCIRSILQRTAQSGMGSFLAVLKKMGSHEPAGWMSFSRPGLTLAMDFPNYGEGLLKLLDELDDLIVSDGGAVNPSKDARMSARVFRHSFPRWRKFCEMVDPLFCSDFWIRVNKEIK